MSTPTSFMPTDNSQIDLSSPVTVLPLVVALVTIVVILVGACFVYHRRQRKRTQELVRQLRVTERRIDAIGIITAKKQQALAARKADYHPPATTPCSSNTTMGVSNVYPQSIHSTVDEQPPSVSNPSSVTYGGENANTYTVTVQVNQHTTDEYDDTKLDLTANDTSYYCSTCKDSVGTSALTQYRVADSDLVNSSMAVECATIPAVSSLSTVCSVPTQKQYRNSQRGKLTRSRSEHHKRGNRFTGRLSRQSINIIRGLRLGLGQLTDSDNTTGGHIEGKNTEAKPDLLPNENGRSIETKVYEYSQTDDESELCLSEIVGCPNTPATSGLGDTSAALSMADCTTDTEGVREKWV